MENKIKNTDPFELLIENSKWIFDKKYHDIDEEIYTSYEVWEKAIRILRELKNKYESKNFPLPNICVGPNNSIDILWDSKKAGIFININNESCDFFLERKDIESSISGFCSNDNFSYLEIISFLNLL